jgi:membrane peptidoglycan carboxypeptidase
MSTEEAFVLSSNIVTGRIANRMEPGRLDFWCRRFGFGQKTGIDLPGESPGRIAQQKNSEFNIAQRSFGHGIAVTPIQLACAYAAIANGGYLVTPHLVESIEDPDGTVIPTPIKGQRILPIEVAVMMKSFARGVVERGTAKHINDSIFVFAGKTGTAEKPDPNTKSYNKNKYMASFVGIYPADNPQTVGLVILDEPEPVHYGGLTSAPVLLRTVQRAASSGDMPVTDLSRFALLHDAGLDHQPDWSDKLVAAVAPIIATPAHASAPSPVENSENSLVRMDTPSKLGCVNGWDRLLACAQKVREENQKILREPQAEPVVTNPVVEETPAVPESDPIAARQVENTPDLAAAEHEEKRP